MSQIHELRQLKPGMKILVQGNRMIEVDDDLARAFQPGDRLCVVDKTGEVLVIGGAESAIAEHSVSRAVSAFQRMNLVSDEQISSFFRNFAAALRDDEVWHQIAEVNAVDVADAKAKGRSTTRLECSDSMRNNMIAGLDGWASAASMRGRVLETIDHGSWKAELVGAELGVVAFIFEGRPNVVADATGVLRGGNTVVFRIGRDALRTAQALLNLATRPALKAAQMPEDAVVLVESASHAAGWALFGDHRLALAVARGSGPAVDTLGSIARSAGVPVSLHGTGGAWLMLGSSASPKDITITVADSLDRKVCNTLNTCCIQRVDAERFLPAFLEGLQRAGSRRGSSFKLHVARGSEAFVPRELFETTVSIDRASGPQREPQAELLEPDQLGKNGSGKNSPEVSLKIVDDLPQAVALFNEQSPQFVACLLSDDPSEQQAFWATVNAPFVGDGFTRWVDGQFALKRPELGLSNWENGRLFGRGGVLSGDSVLTVRTRVTGTKSGRPG